MNITTIGNQPTISTMEIAALVGKAHRNVLRDARKMLAELAERDAPSIGGIGGDELKSERIASTGFDGLYLDERGRQKPCLYLPKREAIIIVTGYDVRRRALLVDRLEQLEAAFAASQQEKLPPPSRELTAPELPRDLFDHQGSTAIDRLAGRVVDMGKRIISNIWKAKNDLHDHIKVSDNKSIERDRYLAKQALGTREEIRGSREDIKAVGGQVQELWRFLTREPAWVTMADFLRDHDAVEASGLVPRLSKEAEGYFTARSLRLQASSPKNNLRATWFERNHLEQWWKDEGQRLYIGFLKKRKAPVVRLVPVDPVDPVDP